MIDSASFLREVRVRSLMWPYYFAKVVLLRTKMVDHLHGKEIEVFLENLLNGMRKQAIEWPRGHYKTTLFTTSWSMWMVLPVTPADSEYALDVLNIDPQAWERRAQLHNQNYAILLAFENDTNARRKIGEIKWHFESNEFFRACFPEIAYTGDEGPWNTEALKIRRTPEGGPIGEATWQSMGVGGAVQSQHYDIIIEDDVVGRKATESTTVMGSTKVWHGQLNGCMNGSQLGMRTIRLLVSNRWGFDDLNSFVRREEKDFIFHTRKVIEPNPDTGEDEPIFPEEFSLAVIENLKHSAGMTSFDFAAQYYNSPVPPGEHRVSDSRLHRYRVDTSGDGEIVCETCGYRTRPSHLRRYMHYDPYNAKGVRSSSAPAIVVVGLSVRPLDPLQPPHIFLLDYWTTRGSYAQVFDKIVEYNDLWWPDLLTYEDAGNQNMCEFHLRKLQGSHEFREAKHRYFRSIKPAPTGGRAKEVRIEQSLFPVFENQCFAVRPKHQTFLNMLETYPHEVDGHDYDLLDALAQGPKFWRHPYSEADTKDIERTEEAYLADLGKAYTTLSRAVQ